MIFRLSCAMKVQEFSQKLKPVWTCWVYSWHPSRGWCIDDGEPTSSKCYLLKLLYQTSFGPRRYHLQKNAKTTPESHVTKLPVVVNDSTRPNSPVVNATLYSNHYPSKIWISEKYIRHFQTSVLISLCAAVTQLVKMQRYYLRVIRVL